MEPGIECPYCHAALVQYDGRQEDHVRCVHCAKVFESGAESRERLRLASRFAWLSLITGVATLLFSLLTAIPAVWMGVKSLRLRRGNFDSHPNGWMAVTGVVIGGVAGAITLVAILSVSTMAAWMYSSINITSDSEIVAQRLEETVEWDKKIDWHGLRIAEFWGSYLVSLADAVEKKKRHRLMSLGYYLESFPQSRAQMIGQINSVGIRAIERSEAGDNLKVQTRSQNWVAMGRETEIIISQHLDAGGEVRAVKVTAILENDRGDRFPFCYVGLVYRGERTSEEYVTEARGIVESLRTVPAVGEAPMQ